MEPFWIQVKEAVLRQGDYLPRCLVPLLAPGLNGAMPGASAHDLTAGEFDLVLLTQSCDLEQRRVRLVAACPIYALAEFEGQSRVCQEGALERGT